MKIKLLEIRDRGTFIPALAVDMNDPGPGQKYLLRRCDYPLDGQSNIMLTNLNGNGSKATNDPYFWGDRTWATAHNFIIDNWNSLYDGAVIDVEYILGEIDIIKRSESEMALAKINPNARPINYDELREGLHLVADGGFDCLTEGEVSPVYRNSTSGFYINCKQGKHELEGQVGPSGMLVGLRVL